MVLPILREEHGLHEPDNLLEPILLKHENLIAIIDHMSLMGKDLINTDLKHAVGRDVLLLIARMEVGLDVGAVELFLYLNLLGEGAVVVV